MNWPVYKNTLSQAINNFHLNQSRIYNCKEKYKTQLVFQTFFIIKIVSRETLLNIKSTNAFNFLLKSSIKTYCLLFYQSPQY